MASSADELKEFLELAKGQKRSWVLLGVIALAFCGLIGGVVMSDGANLPTKVLATVVFGFPVAVLLYHLLRPASRHPAIVALRDHRETIVWVYVLRHFINNAYANTFLGFGTSDGQLYQLTCTGLVAPSARDGGMELDASEKEWIVRARALVPHAVAGYSDEYHQLFSRDPRGFADAVARLQAR